MVMMLIALFPRGASTASLLPPKPKIVLESEFNEASEHQQYSDKLDTMLNRLQHFYSNFQAVRKDTLEQIDALTSLLASQKSIDQLKSFVNSQLNMEMFRSKIREAVKQKMAGTDSAQKILRTLNEFSSSASSQSIVQESSLQSHSRDSKDPSLQTNNHLVDPKVLPSESRKPALLRRLPESSRITQRPTRAASSSYSSIKSHLKKE